MSMKQEYIQKLRDEAVKIALAKSNSLCFDPNGHVLIDVALTAEQQEAFLNVMGRLPTKVVTISLDAMLHDELKAHYMAHYDLKDEQVRTLEHVRGSIIPLQQEFHFHLGLVSRIYSTMDNQLFPVEKMNQAHQSAMQEINKLVIHHLNEALTEATNGHSIDDVALIKALDKARKHIFSQAHDIFAQEVKRVTGQQITPAELKEKEVKHLAEQTTATANDFLYEDNSLKLTTLIEGSNVTAHDRGLGSEHLANRQIMTFAFDGPETERIQIRVSSLDVKKGVGSQEAIADVADKLDYLQTRYDMNSAITESPAGGKGFTYNLLTALNDYLGDTNGNKQSQGARYILRGAHEYNARQLDKPEGERVFCWVQNISVNGFGSSLGYGWLNIGPSRLITEATLMAEMAGLHNLMAHDDPQKAKAAEVFSLYQDYLLSSPRTQYFSLSTQGKAAKQHIQEIKQGWANEPAAPNLADADNLTKVKAALKTMMAHDLHHQHQFAKIYQAMSIFIEQASIAGCKSGNERAQAIAGRVSILDAAAHDKDDKIMSAMFELATVSAEGVSNKAEALKQAIDHQYDLNLQSAVAAISHMDQGAAAKVKAKRTFWGRYGDRNCAEEASLDHLHQSKASAMQAHKEMTKEMSRAVDDSSPISFWARLVDAVNGVIQRISNFFSSKEEVKQPENVQAETVYVEPDVLEPKADKTPERHTQGAENIVIADFRRKKDVGNADTNTRTPPQDLMEHMQKFKTSFNELAKQQDDPCIEEENESRPVIK